MAVLAVCSLFAPSPASAQSQLLDDFESLSGWTPIVSEGAKLNIVQGEGKTDRCMVMDFNLSGVYGYVIAQKEFTLDLSANYQFTFDMRGETPQNNFEFKLLDEHENVFWIKKLNIDYPKEWTRQRIARRQLTFAWGPNPGIELRKVRKIQFVVSSGSGGQGKVFIDNFRFEPIDTAAGSAQASVTVSSAAKGYMPMIDPGGTQITGWRSEGKADKESLTVNFDRLKEVGGLVIEWDSVNYPTSYSVLLSDDGNEWTPGYTVLHGNGGRDYVPLRDGEGRFLRVDLLKSSRQRGYRLIQMTIKEPQFGNSPNDLFRAIAADAPPGYFPKYLLNKQSYWTIMGANGDIKEALINEQGQIEVDKLQFSLEPFLFIDNKLVTWNDATTTPSLLDKYLPIPTVTWHYGDDWTLTIEGVAAGTAGTSMLGVRYSLQSKRAAKAKLFIALRPFQVNPPWQALNIEGGVSRIDTISYEQGVIKANSVTVVPMTTPTAFGAAEFDQGSITDYVYRGMVPQQQSVRDHFGHASAALQYDLALQPGRPQQIYLVVPFHGWRGEPAPNMRDGKDSAYFAAMHDTTADRWREQLQRVKMVLPQSAEKVANTIYSNLGYIFINRDGPGIQPGSRSYERSWIRDGSLTCAALLRLGHPEEVREFIDWYAKGQFPGGKIPCVVDARGPDAVPEHDSNGEFIYAVHQYFAFTKDTAWLKGKWDAIVKTVRFIQSLRAERKTDKYKNGTPEERALYGILPESISHEGYWDVPRHSYWDDFFTIRGLKDATAIAHALGETTLEKEFAAERDDFRKDLYASMRQAMKNTKVNYIPGCAELGDFDATSTTIGVYPGGELGHIPEPELHNTFDKYYNFFVERRDKNAFINYTPYETRVIGTFVLLGEKDRAAEATDFFMNDRRPPAWDEWAEVVWRNPDTPRYIGDMPHTWVGSDFIRSILTMFAYERESDESLVLAAGIPDQWIQDPAGVQVRGLRTYHGLLDFAFRPKGKSVIAEISGTIDVARHRTVLSSPLRSPIRSVKINGRKATVPSSGEIPLKRLPVNVEFTY